jgi:hypothetical protein
MSNFNSFDQRYILRRIRSWILKEAGISDKFPFPESVSPCLNKEDSIDIILSDITRVHCDCTVPNRVPKYLTIKNCNFLIRGVDKISHEFENDKIKPLCQLVCELLCSYSDELYLKQEQKQVNRLNFIFGFLIAFMVLNVIAYLNLRGIL